MLEEGEADGSVCAACGRSLETPEMELNAAMDALSLSEWRCERCWRLVDEEEEEYRHWRSSSGGLLGEGRRGGGRGGGRRRRGDEEDADEGLADAASGTQAIVRPRGSRNVGAEREVVRLRRLSFPIEALFSDVVAAGFAGSPSDFFERPSWTGRLCCRLGHLMESRRALDHEFACDDCGRSIGARTRFWDCHDCDFSLCRSCGRREWDR